MERHWTIACADGRVMCDLCYERFPKEELWVDAEGQRWDTCATCGERENRVKVLLEEGWTPAQILAAYVWQD